MAPKLQQFTLWFRKFLPSGIRKDVALKTALGILAIVVGVQLLYPYERGVPLAKVAGTKVGMATHEELAKVITEKFAATKVKLVLDSTMAVEFELKSAGAEPNTERMIEKLSDYPLWQRFIPGSIVLRPAKVDIVDVFYTSILFKEFIDTKSKELTFAPTNARLAIEDGRLIATEAIEGSEVDSTALLAALSKSNLQLGGTTEIGVPAKRTPAQTYSKDLAEVYHAAEAALAHTVVIKVDTREFTPEKTEIASWIVLTEANDGRVTLAVDREKVKTYLNTLNEHVGVPAGQTNITMIDGREVARSDGAVGRALAVETMAEEIASGLLNTTSVVAVNAQFKDVLPGVLFNSKYTATQEGLQAYVSDQARTKNVRISIQQLDGGKWHAEARGNESTVSGSTYKLYVALILFDKIDKGEVRWEDSMLDTTVAGCFERMVVASTNPCAEAWLSQWGRQYVNDFIYARGFSGGTTFMSTIATHTTANDLTKFMIGLSEGALVSGANRDRLLDALGRHPYRYGIPTGSRGQVNDKVGFIWDYINDTAIVHHPRGTYVMTILTKGYSYATIASITREVEKIMYP